jgi:hypothetical protein
VRDHPEWSAGSSYVIFRDHKLLKGKPHAYVERVQMSGLCYMHAPVVMQHYLVAMSSVDKVPMLDIAKYMKRYMPVSSLSRHILEDFGGQSFEFLENILIQNPRPVFVDCDLANPQSICKLMRKFGPGLLSHFMVSDEF